jgi:hypothetical protein
VYTWSLWQYIEFIYNNNSWVGFYPIYRYRNCGIIKYKTTCSMLGALAIQMTDFACTELYNEHFVRFSLAVYSFVFGLYSCLVRELKKNINYREITVWIWFVDYSTYKYMETANLGEDKTVDQLHHWQSCV